MRVVPAAAAALAAFGALASAPPDPPAREEWGFVRELATREPYRSHWSRAAKDGELDFSRGVRVVDDYGVGGDLETATRDLSDFLSDVGLANGEVPLRLARRDMGCREAYSIEVTASGATLAAGDDDGMRRAIYHFEDCLLSSEAPAIAYAARTRRPWVRIRLSRCFFGPIKRPPFNRDELMDDVDYYPDAYLNRLAHEGVNALWLTVEFQDLATTSFTKRSPGADRRLAKLRRTVEKCRRYGMKTFLFAIEPHRLDSENPLRSAHPEMIGASGRNLAVVCSSTEAGRKYLEESLESIFREVPGLGGLINVCHGERYTTCLSFISPVKHGGYGPSGDFKSGCPRCDALEPWQVHTNTVTAMLRGVRRGNPDAEVLSQFYQPQVQPERAPWVYDVARHVPEGVTLMYNFESGALKDQCGRMRTGGDYWLSFAGPSTSFERMAEAAAEGGCRIGVKIQVGCSHEVATVPFVPAPGLLYRKYRAMKAAGVSAVIQCWYFGNYPGPMNKAAGELSFEDFRDDEKTFLERLARIDWGKDAPLVADVWGKISDAYENYPLSNDMQYYGPFHAGVAWPLYADVRLRPLGRTWKPLDDPSGDTIGEALENHTLDEAIMLADRMAEGMRILAPDGSDVYAKLLARHSGSRQRRLDIGVMRALALQFESGRDILRFYRERSEAIWRSRDIGDNAGARACLARMKDLVRREREVSAEMLRLSLEDSRLGFHSEAESHQYHPAKLKWRDAELASTEAQIDAIDAALARGERYPKSEFERNAPSCRAGGDWTLCKGFRFRVDDAGDGDVTVTVATGAKRISLYTYDAAGTLWPRGVSVDSKGKVDNPLQWNVVTPCHDARAAVSKEGGEFVYKVRLSAFGWGRDTRLRPSWLQINAGGASWPGLPNPGYRLNLSSVYGNIMGRIARD